MEKLAMRIMLLVVMGAFLLLSGVFMDVMGSQINSSSSESRPNIPFNPLVLVGRCVLAVGAAMLAAAVYFTVRVRFSEKRRSEYQRESTSPDILGDTTSNNNRSQPYSQHPLRQSLPMPSPIRSQSTPYSDAYVPQHREYPHENHLFGRHLMNYTSAPTLPRQHTPTLADHHLRYSETYEDRDHIRFSTVSDSPAEALITAYRLPARATSPYLEEEEMSRYSESPTEHAFQPIRYNRWERHSERVPVIRGSVPNPDLPPPYESTDIPPSYISLSSSHRAQTKI